ncbi:MAG TPA: hypothetical protein VGC95_09135, partial [Chitinophagaceae bacterium]
MKQCRAISPLLRIAALLGINIIELGVCSSKGSDELQTNPENNPINMNTTDTQAAVCRSQTQEIQALHLTEMAIR